MGINIKEKDGNIEFSEVEKYSQNDLLNKYRNDLYAKKLLKAQVEKAPNTIKEKESEKEIRQNQIKEIEDRMKKSEKIFKDRNLDPNEELQKLREKYSDEEIEEKSKNISEKKVYEVKDHGTYIERKTKNQISLEDEIILYAVNKWNKLQAQELLVNIQKEIEKIQSRLEVQKTELEKVENSIQSIENYFKRKRLDINKLLDQQANQRKKQEKTAQELNVK
ncbi:MAG: hypothetical protein ACOC44_10005 [Promethearchaeia archaeon]